MLFRSAPGETGVLHCFLPPKLSEKEEWVTDSGCAGCLRGPPFLRGLVFRTRGTGDRTRGTHWLCAPHHRCGTVPGSHRTSLHCVQHLYRGAGTTVAECRSRGGNLRSQPSRLCIIPRVFLVGNCSHGTKMGPHNFWVTPSHNLGVNEEFLRANPVEQRNVTWSSRVMPFST